MKYRWPLVGLLAVVVVCALLGVVGLRVEGDLEPISLSVPGTQAAKAEALADSHFGDSSPFIVLLRGPAAAVDRQGPSLVRELGAIPTPR